MATTPSPRAAWHRTIALVMLPTMLMMLGHAPGAAAAGDGCGLDQPGVVGQVEHPIDASAVVLQLSVDGGFVPREVAFLDQDPRFVLFGNGTVIFRPQAEEESLALPWPPYQCVRLTPTEVDELLRFALGEGGLASAAASYAHPFVADAPTTTFTVDADGTATSASIAALGFENAPDQAASAGFEALAERLLGFADEVEDEVAYDAIAYELLVLPWWGDPAAEAMAWPWPELSLDDLEPSADGQVGELSPDQAASITEIPSGGRVLVPIRTPDGRVLSASIRPILPGSPGQEETPQ